MHNISFQKKKNEIKVVMYEIKVLAWGSGIHDDHWSDSTAVLRKDVFANESSNAVRHRVLVLNTGIISQ